MPVVRTGEEGAQADVHGLRGLLHFKRQRVVFAARLLVARGMIVAEHQVGGTAEQCLFEDEAHVDHRTRDAAPADEFAGDEAQLLVEQQGIALLHRGKLHAAHQVAVDAVGRREARLFLVVFRHAPFAQLAGRQNGDGFGRPHAFVLAQLADAAVAQRGQTPVAVVHHALHQLHGVLFRIARPYQDGQQLRLAQGGRALGLQLFARAVFCVEFGNTDFHDAGEGRG